MADEARARIDEEMRYLRGRRNALSPICRLPSEQLAAIFIRSALDHHRNSSHTPIQDVPSWVNVSHVCRHWRNVALDYPTLWTYHFVLSLRWTEELLARSKQAPLKISITFTESKSKPWWTSLVKKLMKHVERIQEFRLHFPDRCHSHILSKLSFSAPHLQNLEISVKRDLFEWSSVLFQGNTPALCTLELSRCSVPWYLFKLTTLTTLSLKRVPDRFRQSTKEFLATLSCMQDLTYLHLEGALASASGFLSSAAFYTFQKINLPRLSRLYVVAPLSAVTALLSCTCIPLKTEIRLGCNSEDDSSLDDFALLSSVLAQRYSMSENQTSPAPTIRSLIIDSDYGWTNNVKLKLSASERDCDSSVAIPHPEWGCNIPLKIEVQWDGALVDVDRVVGDMCCAIPLTRVQSMHVICPPFSLAFWRKILGHLQDLRYLKLSRGNMPDLASVLSLSDSNFTVDTAMEDQSGLAPADPFLVPRLETLVLYRVNFAEGDEPAQPELPQALTQRRIFDALSTRDVPQGRLIMNQCKIGDLMKWDMVRSWDGVFAYEDGRS